LGYTLGDCFTSSSGHPARKAFISEFWRLQIVGWISPLIIQFWQKTKKFLFQFRRFVIVLSECIPEIRIFWTYEIVFIHTYYL
jgi:hypothetical protein